MKFFAVFLLAVNVSFAADFVTGQAARLVIGQTTFTAQETAQDTAASQTLLGGAGGLAYANNMLVVTDANRVGADPLNHRVLLYQNLASMLPGPTDVLEQSSLCPVCVGAPSVVLGQPDFTSASYAAPPNEQSLRTPTAVATDGTILAVADTDNNRVLIWKSIPSANQAPPDVVVGQPNFSSNAVRRPPNASSLSGPQGVWIQNGKLFVADTYNHRVLIWNSIPTSNGSPADIVLGQAGFNTFVQQDLIKFNINVAAETLLSPISVTSDGQRLYVADLGHNRVLIWNSIPTRNQQPADVVVGQPDMTSMAANYYTKLCPSNGTDSDGNATYPARCAATLDFPRYALSDGQRLFIADGGNDRVLIYNQVPTANGQSADVILGQPSGEVNLVSETSNEYDQASLDAVTVRRAAADTVRTPLSLAWDGTNLYVSDPFNRRVMVFTPAEMGITYAGIRNAASRSIHAFGYFDIAGSINKGDVLTLTIGDKEYEYTVVEDDTVSNVITTLVKQINASDTLVYATPNLGVGRIMLTARAEGEAGNSIAISASTSTDAKITATASSTTLDRGQDAAKIAPGTLVMILGEDLADQTAVAPPDADPLPTEMAGVRVYFDGLLAPLLYVSPTQINAQVPWEVQDRANVSVYARTQWQDGRVTVTNAMAAPIVGQNPGIFAFEGEEPRAGVVLHSSNYATGTISVDGSIVADEVGTVTIEDREYQYTVQTGDTLVSIRDAFVALINQDPKVEAFPSAYYSRIRLKARVPGPEGDGITFSATVTTGGSLQLTALNTALCCANEAGSLVTDDNPALPGETILIYATGLGLVTPDEAKNACVTGAKYQGPEFNNPVESVTGMAGSITAQVLSAALKPGWNDVYEVQLEVYQTQPTNPLTQLWISQGFYISNVVTFPVYRPTPTD